MPQGRELTTGEGLIIMVVGSAFAYLIVVYCCIVVFLNVNGNPFDANSSGINYGIKDGKR